jgi:hypothetical protein
MDIIRNADGTLVVPVAPARHHEAEDHTGNPSSDHGEAQAVAQADAGPGPGPATRVLHPGEGGYDEALSEWDLQQNPDREPAVSTVSGRQEAMTLVHAVATAPGEPVAPAVESLEDPEASGEALRHVLVGGVHAIEDFASEVAEAEGGDVLTAHQTTKIIGEVLSELDS